MDADLLKEIKEAFGRLECLPEETQIQKKFKELCLKYYSIQCEELGYVRSDGSKRTASDFEREKRSGRMGS